MESNLTFKEKFKMAIKDLHLTQAQVSGLTGCSKASICQYLSGRNIPSDDKQREIAVALGLDADYFGQKQPAARSIPRKRSAAACVERMSVTEAADMMQMSPETVRQGLQQGVFPWGYGIKTTSTRWTYFINAKRFASIEMTNSRA